MHRFERSLTLPISREQFFAWHERPGAFERLAPSWQRIELVERRGTIHEGDRLHFRVHQGPLKIDWVARHVDYEPGLRFVDVAVRSPFAAWRHLHAFEDAGRGGSTLRDQIDLRLPVHVLTWPLVGHKVDAMLERMFRQRHLRLAIDLRRHDALRDHGPKRVALGGTPGVLRDQLAAFWTTGGHELLGRESSGSTPPVDVRIELEEGLLEIGERSLARLGHPKLTPAGLEALAPAEVVVFVAPAFLHPASLHRDELQPLVEVAGRAGARVVILRTGVVLHPRHPLLRGPRARLADEVATRGFLDLDDLIGLVHHAVHSPALEGPIHAVASDRLRELGVELDFPTLERSVAHQRGREDEEELERALAAFEAQARGAGSETPPRPVSAG